MHQIIITEYHPKTKLILGLKLKKRLFEVEGTNAIKVCYKQDQIGGGGKETSSFFKS